MTEHQIEKMKERRSDIPALYNDLSQTASQSVISNHFASSQSFDEGLVVYSFNTYLIIIIGPFKQLFS